MNPFLQEGFIFLEESFGRIKVKSSQFVSASTKKYKPINLCAHLHLQEIDVWNICRTNSHLEMLSYFPEMREDKFVGVIIGDWERVVDYISSNYKKLKGTSESEFAKTSSQYWCSALFFSEYKGRFFSWRHVLALQEDHPFESFLKKIPKSFLSAKSSSKNNTNVLTRRQQNERETKEEVN